MRLIQYLSEEGQRHIGVVESESRITRIAASDSVYALAHRALTENTSLRALAEEFASDIHDDYDAIVRDGRLLVPLDHPVDTAHCVVSGTGFTHLGTHADPEALRAKHRAGIDASREPVEALVAQGLVNGKPSNSAIGAQPEWFYKGNGACLVPCYQPLERPSFALSATDEAEIAALYVISPEGYPARVGYALANEFCDAAMESSNPLLMGASKLRACAVGPELLLGELPGSISGSAKIRRHGEVAWSSEFSSGTDVITHALSNLEHHHFKHAAFRQPGDVHIHLLGAAASSNSDGFEAQAGDVFEIESPTFGRALENALTDSPPLEFGVVIL